VSFNPAGVAQLMESLWTPWEPVRDESVCEWVEANVDSMMTDRHETGDIVQREKTAKLHLKRPGDLKVRKPLKVATCSPEQSPTPPR
jgi:hypothetical protein